MTRLQSYLLIVLVAVVGGAWIHITRVPTNDQVAAQVAAHVNFQSPDFTLQTLDGKQIALSDYRGKVVLINFWATWCPPCRDEMQSIQGAHQDYPDNFVVLAINNAEGPVIVQQFFDSVHLTFPILLDLDGAVAREYRVQGLPTSYFIDKSGIVRVANVGGMNRSYIQAQVETLGAR